MILNQNVRHNGPEMRSLLDEGISKPLDGSVSTPQALPRHSPPCHADCKICIFMKWPFVVFRNLYLYRQYLHSQFLLCTFSWARHWVHPTMTPHGQIDKLWRTSNYRLTLKYDPGEVLVRPNRESVRAPIIRILCTLTAHLETRGWQVRSTTRNIYVSPIWVSFCRTGKMAISCPFFLRSCSCGQTI